MTRAPRVGTAEAKTGVANPSVKRMPFARPHDNPRCDCIPCRDWDELAREAPLTRCAETHAQATLAPCQHGFTRWCPCFGIKFSYS